MPEVTFRKPTEGDIFDCAARMRAADSAEVQAIGMTPLKAVVDSVERSEFCQAVLFNGEVAGIFGRTPAHSMGRTVAGGERAVTVWLLTTEVVDQHPFTFLRLSRPVMRRLFEGVQTAITLVDSRYRTCLRWAEWLGFELLGAQPMGAGAPPFVSIRWRRA
jgi:hypothetical protein